MSNSKITSDILYQFFILAILVKLGGSAETYTVMNRIYEVYRDKFTEKDLEDYEVSKEPRWKNYIRFARQRLIEAECLRRDSPHGFWEITDEGRRQHGEWVDSIRKNLSKTDQSI